MKGVYVRKHRGVGLPFSVDELAFFQVPRTWAAITARFGKKSRSMDAVLDADSDGGRGLLDWSKTKSAWHLTEAGRVATREVRAA